MSKYRMDDGKVVDTDKATAEWVESTRWNGNNHVSVQTGSQWVHETLYQSAKGRYYVVTTSQWQGSTPSARWLTNEEAVKWLLLNGDDVPDDLKALVDAVEE